LVVPGAIARTQAHTFAMGGTNAKKENFRSRWTAAEYFDAVHEYALN